MRVRHTYWLPRLFPEFLKRNRRAPLFSSLSPFLFLSSPVSLSYPHRALSSTFALSMMEIQRNLFAIPPSHRSARQEFNFLSAIRARWICTEFVRLSYYLQEPPRIKLETRVWLLSLFTCIIFLFCFIHLLFSCKSSKFDIFIDNFILLR